jgi:predicted exporter
MEGQHMNLRKSPANVLAAVIGVSLIAAIAIWQFYLFVTFKNTQGLMDVQGGTQHLWWALGAALIACLAGFLVCSAFVSYDKDNEIHITS